MTQEGRNERGRTPGSKWSKQGYVWPPAGFEEGTAHGAQH